MNNADARGIPGLGMLKMELQRVPGVRDDPGSDDIFG
jgi:hypothetical protein